jgi:uncharacterized damage-inducible protein DinB
VRSRDYAATLLQLVAYEVWCNLRALDALDELTDEERRRDFGFGLRTPHRTMFHIADVMQGWGGCVGPVVVPPKWIDYDAHASLASIRAMVQRAGDDWLAAARASHEKGVLGAERRLHQLLHLVTHGPHHRGQLLSMLTLLGRPHPFEGGDFGGWSASR